MTLLDKLVESKCVDGSDFKVEYQRNLRKGDHDQVDEDKCSVNLADTTEGE